MDILNHVKKDLMNRVVELSIIDNLVNTIYVDSSVPTVASTETFKENNLIVNKTTTKEYKLSTYKVIFKSGKNGNMIISDQVGNSTIRNNQKICSTVAEDLNANFISYINRTPMDTYNFNIIKQNLFKQIFYKTNTIDLISKIVEVAHDYSWAIVSPTIYNLIKSSVLFQSKDMECKCLISNVGSIVIDNIKINIYLNSGQVDNKVILGKEGSVSLIIKRYPMINELKSFTVKYDNIVEVLMNYSFVNSNELRQIIIS